MPRVEPSPSPSISRPNDVVSGRPALTPRRHLHLPQDPTGPRQPKPQRGESFPSTKGSLLESSFRHSAIASCVTK
eukprot:3072287-Pyramimonas_sp.AAC.1